MTPVATPTEAPSPQPTLSPDDLGGTAQDREVAAGTQGVPLVSFGLRNPGVSTVLLNTVSVPLDADSVILERISRARLLLDTNGNGTTDADEPVVAQTTSQITGLINFTLSQSLALQVGELRKFIVLIDFD